LKTIVAELRVSKLPDFEGIAMFAKVAEEGSFAAAAATMGVSVSTVSRAVTRLEERLGGRLFNRTSRRLALTLTEREEISRALVAGRSIRSIAMQLERAIAFVQLAAKPAGIDVRGLKVNIREHDSSRSQPKAASTKESTSASVEAVTLSLYWSPMA
jgi:molybdenum-dependent DNA-binding transcriptional regulator ModE